MHLSTITTFLATAAALTSAVAVDTLDVRAATAPATLPAQGDFIWRISKFRGTRPKGTYYTSISFEVYATNSAWSISCSHQGTGAMDERGYFCQMGVNDMTFTYNREHGAGRDHGGLAMMGNLLTDKG